MIEKIQELEELKIFLDNEKAKIADKEQEFKEKKEELKKEMAEKGLENCNSENYVFKLGKRVSKKVDEKALKSDGLLEKYQVTSETVTLSMRKAKETKENK